MYLAEELTQKSLPEIGELFGGRDHTTVLHAVRKISAERQQLTELNQQLHVLEHTLKGSRLRANHAHYKHFAAPVQGQNGVLCSTGRRDRRRCCPSTVLKTTRG